MATYASRKWMNLLLSSCSVVSALWHPINCSLPGSSVHRISQERILEWVPFPALRDPPEPGVEPVSLPQPLRAHYPQHLRPHELQRPWIPWSPTADGGHAEVGPCAHMHTQVYAQPWNTECVKPQLCKWASSKTAHLCHQGHPSFVILVGKSALCSGSRH